jgi:predicted small metal-binding protein
VRVIDCECGTTIKAANEEELEQQVRRHLESDHPGDDMGDDDVRELVAARSYDAMDA